MKRVTITVDDAKAVTGRALVLSREELEALPQPTLMEKLSLARSVLHLLTVDGRQPGELTETEQAYAEAWQKLASDAGVKLGAQSKENGFDYYFEQMPVADVIEPVLPVGPEPEPTGKRSKK